MPEVFAGLDEEVYAKEAIAARGALGDRLPTGTTPAVPEPVGEAESDADEWFSDVE